MLDKSVLYYTRFYASDAIGEYPYSVGYHALRAVVVPTDILCLLT
jgi:hypothetical protein